jgi:hypothetical protein
MTILSQPEYELYKKQLITVFGNHKRQGRDMTILVDILYHNETYTEVGQRNSISCNRVIQIVNKYKRNFRAMINSDKLTYGEEVVPNGYDDEDSLSIFERTV